MASAHWACRLHWFMINLITLRKHKPLNLYFIWIYSDAWCPDALYICPIICKGLFKFSTLQFYYEAVKTWSRNIWRTYRVKKNSVNIYDIYQNFPIFLLERFKCGIKNYMERSVWYKSHLIIIKKPLKLVTKISYDLHWVWVK